MKSEENVSIEPTGTDSPQTTYMTATADNGDDDFSPERLDSEEEEKGLTADDMGHSYENFRCENDTENKSDTKDENPTHNTGKEYDENFGDGDSHDSENGESDEEKEENRLATIALNDLHEIHTLFPESAQISHICELKDAGRYAALRELGLSVKEAYLATNGYTETRAHRPSYDNRSHIISAVPRQTANSDIGMSRSELEEAKQIFGNLTEKEIRNLYRRAKG